MKILLTPLFGLIAIITLSGCSGFKLASLEEVKKIQPNNSIEVETKNTRILQFPPRGYIIQNDTLFAERGLEIFNNNEPSAFRGKIAIEEIVAYRIKGNVNLFEDIVIASAIFISVLIAAGTAFNL